MKPPAPSWAGLVALVLAVGVSIGVAVSLVVVAFQTEPNAELIAVITTLGGAAVGAVGTYMGASRYQAQGATETLEPDSREPGSSEPPPSAYR